MSIAPPATDTLADLEAVISQLRDAGAMFWRRGWSLGTSSNYSVVTGRDPLELLITASGMDKGHLGPRDFVRVDSTGRPTSDGQPKSSAETMLHVAIADELPEVGAVLHTHSVWSTLLSDVHAAEGGLMIEGYEMLKGLAGVRTHEHRQWVPIFENTQDIATLAEELRPRLRGTEAIGHGFLMRGHGLYTWGESLDEARRHVEIFEFLLECLGRRMSLHAHPSVSKGKP